MPIYEYHCNDCGEDFERLVFGNEKPDCISCDSSKVNKMMSACGFVSRGGSGGTVKTAASDSSCGGCAASSCTGCSN